MNHDLDFNSHSAINLKTPRQQQNDAIPYQDNFFVLMYRDISCMGLTIFNIGPNNNRDQVVNGGYVIDNLFQKKNQDTNMDNKKIINLKNPENDTDAVN